jgi:elongation factor Ts
MTTVSNASLVKALRDRTGATYAVCTAALAEAGGNLDKAVEVIRIKLGGAAGKFLEREASEGRIGVFIDPAKKIGAIVEIRCESAPVTKAEQFIAMVNDVASHAATSKATTVADLLAEKLSTDGSKTVQERINDVIGLIRENMKLARFARYSGTCGSYIHHDGTVGVLLLVEGTPTDPQVLKDVCMHIAATSPVSALREHIPAATLEKEREIAKAQAAATGKPQNIIDKIAEGKLKSWVAENVLLEQPFVKDESKTVGQLLSGAGLKFKKFVRLRVGEVTG